MNAVQTAPSRHLHPPSVTESVERTSRPVRRVGLLDRLALRVGVALIVWGRRPARAARGAASERYATAAEQRQLQLARHSYNHQLNLTR